MVFTFRSSWWFLPELLPSSLVWFWVLKRTWVMQTIDFPKEHLELQLFSALFKCLPALTPWVDELQVFKGIPLISRARVWTQSDWSCILSFFPFQTGPHCVTAWLPWYSLSRLAGQSQVLGLKVFATMPRFRNAVLRLKYIVITWGIIVNSVL